MDKPINRIRLLYMTPAKPHIPYRGLPPRHFVRRARKIMICLGLAMSCFLAACATSKDPEEGKPAAKSQSAIVGRVASISADKAFVLIQAYGEWKVAAGTVLTTRGEKDRAANLLVTGERLGQFAAADIQSGEVLVGDAVLQLPPSTPESTANPSPTAPDSTSETLPSESASF